MVRSKRFVLATGIAAVLLSLLYFFFDPSATNYFPPCPFFAFTGFYCPGCGSQRALHDLLHGNIAAASGHNILFVTFMPLVMFSAIASVNNLFNSRKIGQRLFYSPSLAWVILGAVVLFWIFRNIRVYPFMYLAP